MVERRFGAQLSSLALKSSDVEVYSKLTGQTDREAALDLIEMQFSGSEIRDVMVNSTRYIDRKQARTLTRRQSAHAVFESYLK